MNEPTAHGPTRAELRYVGIEVPPGSGLSKLLCRALYPALIGFHDGEALFSHLKGLGLGPQWDETRSSIGVKDPVAGDVLLRCELTSVTVH